MPAGLSFKCTFWVAPVDARRVELQEDAGKVTAEQVRALLSRLPERNNVPHFVFDTGYDPVRLQLDVFSTPLIVPVRGLAGDNTYDLVLPWG